MNLLVAWKKVLLFGAFGAVGCLAGWLVGEPYLAVTGSGREPSLISKPVQPSVEPPPPPREFQDRLNAAGAKTGDVQISLIWFNENDLDLHCVDPAGFEICWKPNQRRSPRTGGELDVDRNAGCRLPLTVEPVENIYWARGSAPMGRYSVYLDFYQRCGSAGSDESKYRINVLHGSERKEFSGTIRKDSTDGAPMRLIYEFQLRPRIELFAADKLEVAPGSTLKIPVVLRRDFFQGKVEVRAEGLPANVTGETLVLQPSQSEGELILKAAEAATPGETGIKLVATGEDVSHSADPKLTVAKPAAGFSLWTMLTIGIWTALLAVGLCLALLAGQNDYLGKPFFAPGRVPLALVILGAFAAGFVSGSIGQTLYSVLLLADVSLGFIGRLLGWTLLGGLLGRGVSFFIPNLDPKKAALAGLGGGLLGGLAFAVMSSIVSAVVPVRYLAELIGRFGGAALLGFCIGLMVAVVEVAFRRAWLEVRFNEREMVSVNLGPEPVKVGGDPRSCTVWARGAADVALRYWIRDGKVYCEDVPTRSQSIVGHGDTRMAGRVTVVVRTGNAPLPPIDNPPRPARRALPASAPLLIPATPLDEDHPQPVPPPSRPVSASKPAQPDYDDDLPMPMGPPPPARPAATSILDLDGPRPAATVRPPQPPAPARPVVPAPVPKPGAPAPPVPAARPPAPPAPPSPAAAKSVAPPAPKPPAPAAAKATAPPAPQPQVPAAAKTVAPPVPVAAKPVAPPAPKPPAPAATKSMAPPAPQPPAAGSPSVPKPGDSDACPSCGRKSQGKPGARYCMVCDRTF